MAIWDKWLGNSLDRLGYAKKADVRSPALQAFFAGEAPVGQMIETGTLTSEDLERLAVTCAWVFRDVNLIAQTLSAIPFGVHRRVGEGLEAIVNHPFEILFEWANEFMDQSWLIEYSAWWYCLRGESYWMLVADKAGKELRELWPLPASRVRPIPDAQNYIRGYVYTAKTTGMPYVLKPEEVCFVRRPNPFEYHRGLSPISAYRLDMLGDIEAAQWNTDAYENELALRMLLSVPQETSDVTFEQIKEDIRDELIAKKRHYLIVRAGDVEAKEYGLTHKDAEYLASREFTSKEIDSVYGIPEGFWSVRANRANAEAAKATFYENAVWPIAVKFARAITGQILFRYYDRELRGKFEDVRPRNRELEIEERRLHWTGYTFDEVREDLGYDPFPDEEIGAMPYVWVARGPQQAQGAGAMLGGLAVSRAPGQGEKALRDDLRRWRGVAVRRFREGKGAVYPFESEVIPETIRLAVLEALEVAKTEEEVKAAFAAGFRAGHGLETTDPWAAYP